jgi:hypothetical protein
MKSQKSRGGRSLTTLTSWCGRLSDEIRRMTGYGTEEGTPGRPPHDRFGLNSGLTVPPVHVAEVPILLQSRRSGSEAIDAIS